ncbi:hypothetical protein [Nocardioides terrisoli]|uniref:hypothetical protein n=1 Tax=Nocardioides terrisoli TaxID=3388267 RepID=UPI00287BAE14|nr:hypothetical protein [Nocardioides marmorisolisilvae]
MSAVDPVPSGGRLIHLGPPKTGTTVVQGALAASRDSLAQHGVGVLPQEGTRAWEATLSLIGKKLPGGAFAPDIALWEDFVRSADALSADKLVVSDEAFAKATGDAVTRLICDLGGPQGYFVYVVRRIDKLMLSAWQETLKGGLQRRSLGEWLPIVLGDDRSKTAWRNFWQSQDLDEFTGRFLEHVPPDRLILVVADEGNSNQLLPTFERLLGVPGGTLQLPKGKRTNRSLTLNEAELVRQVFARGRDADWSKDDKWFLVREGLVMNHLGRSERRAEDVSLRIPNQHRDPIKQLTADRIAKLGALQRDGAQIVGEPSWLEVPDDGFADLPTPEELTLPVAAVADLVAATVEAARRRPKVERKDRDSFQRQSERVRGS